MSKLTFGPVLALSITAGGLMATSPAHATVWHNLASDKCLGVADGERKNNTGQPLVIWSCDGSANQNWTEAAFTPDPGFSWFSSTVGAGIGLPISLFMGISNNNLNNNTPIIDWTRLNASNQGWQKRFATTDAANHSCFYFVNGALPGPHPARTGVLSVSGGRKDDGAPVVIRDWSKLNTVPPTPDFAGHPDQYWCAY